MFREGAHVSGGRGSCQAAILLFRSYATSPCAFFGVIFGAVATAPSPDRVAPFTRLFASGRPPILCGVHQSSHVAPGE